MIPQGNNIFRSPIPVKTWMVSPWSWCVGSKLFKHQNVHKHDCKIGEGCQTFSLPPAQSQTALLHWSGRAVLSRWTDYDVTFSRQDSDFEEFSHNPAVGRFAPLTLQSSTYTTFEPECTKQDYWCTNTSLVAKTKPVLSFLSTAEVQ